MQWFNLNSVLLAEEAVTKANPAHWYQLWWVILLALVGVSVASFVLGNFLAKSFRMADYGWRIGLILASIACGAIVVGAGWPPKLGVDLKGGVTLIYQIKEPEPVPGEKGVAEKIDVNALVVHLKERLNPSGTKEIVIRPFGEDKVEIIVPDVGPDELAELKRKIWQAGFLQFLIVANTEDHAAEIQMAREENQKGNQLIYSGKKAVAKWVRIGREEKEIGGVRRFRTLPSPNNLIRDAKSGEILTIPGGLYGDNDKTHAVEHWLKDQGHDEVDILMYTDDPFHIEGQHLGSVRSSSDQFANPCINFNPTAKGASLFGGLTSTNLPDPTTNLNRQLGIVLDDVLLSAPNIKGTITDSGQITGSFTQKEVDFLVGILRAGRLPAAIKKEPLSEDQIDSHLGREMKTKGVVAISISLFAVLGFMAVYYRFSGIVACAALMMNILLIVAITILVKQPFTLTGLAGLVLTVGMSVDANVLIFERIREELNRGAGLRMAIRNGFGRATTTIIDANLTTLITAVVLYVIGTDQIRGFAVTLILGILMSMFTAIFCSRVVFDIAERQRWITHLAMFRLLGNAQFDFVKKQYIAIGGSTVLILIGLVGVYARGTGIFAIDLSGGSSVRVVLKAPMTVEEVRQRVAAKMDNMRINGAQVSYTISKLTTSDLEDGVTYKIDSSIPKLEPEQVERGEFPEGYRDLTDVIKDAFQDNGTTLLAMYSMDYTPLQVVHAGGAAAPKATSNSPTKTKADTTVAPLAPAPEKNQGSRLDLPSDLMLAVADDVPRLLAQADDSGTKAADETPANTDESPTPSADKPVAEAPVTEQPAVTPPATTPPVTEQPAVTPPATTPPVTEPPAVTPPATTPPVAEPPAATPPATEPSPTTSEPAATAEPSAATPPDSQPQPDEPATLGPIAGVETKTTLKFGYEIKGDVLKQQILKTATELKVPLNASNVKLNSPEATAESAGGFKQWDLDLTTHTEQDAHSVLERLKQDISDRPYFRGESGVGGQIAANTQFRAIGALLASLLGIVGYIWVRFQKFVYGLAAVLALVHDVLFVLGAIAVSYWLAGTFGFLLIDEFKISLPVVAAFLTIIGYSLNDTIVVFDRIREVRGKSPDLTGDMINVSISQTLSRTLLTSLTTLIVVVILYAIGGEEIHGFAFALTVGVVVGTYSSIFIASPVLLWILGSEHKSPKGKIA